jgi:Protein of unknown function (DUF3987)
MAMTCEDDANRVDECAVVEGDEEGEDLELAQWIRERMSKRPCDREKWPWVKEKWLPTVEAAPLDVLPEPMARLAQEIGRAVGCDPCLPMGTMLAVAGGLIGRAARLQVGPRWFARPTIFYAGVGRSGEGKSRSQGYVTQPALEIERELVEEFEQHQAAMGCSTGERPRLSGDEKADTWAPAAAGRWRAVVDGGTVESWLRILARKGNERGILVVSDDISRLGLNVQGIGRGSSRQVLMRAWSNSTVNIGQSRDAPDDATRIVEPQISITGCVTPEMLRAMHNPKRDDGLLDRWLFVYADRWSKPKSHERLEVSEEALRGWTEIARRLWTWAPRIADGAGGGLEILHYSEEGKAAFDEGHDRHLEEMNDADFAEYLHGPWARLETYAGRFWLILSLLHHAADGEADPATMPVASKEAALGAWRLVECFKTHARRVYSYLYEEREIGPPRGARLIVRWIANHLESDVVTFRDLTRHYATTRGYDREMLMQGACWLQQHKVLRVIAGDKGGSSTGGRPRGRVWEINPHLTFELLRG